MTTARSASAGPSARATSEAAVPYGVENLPLLTAAEAAALDRGARERWVVPEPVLMENAGRSAALILSRFFPDGPVIAAVGAGHNGGDAIVALRNLRAWGRDVAWIQAASRPPDAGLMHGHELRRIEPDALGEELAGAGVVIDGILGTGARGAPREDAAVLIRRLNASGRPILALDVPSGVDPTTGAVPGEAVAAAVTVSFGPPKTGLLFFPGRGRCGDLLAVEIGFPPASETPPGAALLTHAWAAAHLPARRPDAHKGGSGELLVLAGSSGMAGAAVIAAEAAYAGGAGLVRIASTAANREVLQGAAPEAVFLDRSDTAALRTAAERADAVLAGPGMGLDDEAAAAMDAVLAHATGAVLLDADALTRIGREHDRLRELSADRAVVLTPHPGEMARLTGATVDEVLADRIAAARELAARSGCVVLLKGAPSLVAAPGRPVLVNTVGSSDLAVAGMGDQLAGTVGALMAAGAPARHAAGAGLFFSGLAAVLAARGRSLGPKHVSARLPEAFGHPEAQRLFPFVVFEQALPR